MHPVLAIHLFGAKELVFYAIIIIAILAVAMMVRRNQRGSDASR